MDIGNRYPTAQAERQAEPSAIERMEAHLDECKLRLEALEAHLMRASDRLYGPAIREAKQEKLNPIGNPEPLSRRIDAVRQALNQVELAAMRLDRGN